MVGGGLLGKKRSQGSGENAEEMGSTDLGDSDLLGLLVLLTVLDLLLMSEPSSPGTCFRASHLKYTPLPVPV